MPGIVRSGLEDDFHRFLLELHHADGVVLSVTTRTDRYPWSSCARAGDYLADQVIGRSLETIGRLDPHSHCTHLFELLVVGAAHVHDFRSLQIDMRVPDRENDRTWATLSENGAVVLRWEVNGTRLEGSGTWAGRDLRDLSKWKKDLSPVLAERSMLLRRALHVSNRRTSKIDVGQRAADRGSARMGACFTYQLPRALESYRSPDFIRDFSHSGGEPLADFDVSESRPTT
jgi:hypothetical protein